MAKSSNLFSRIMERLQLRGEGETPAAAEEKRSHPTPEAVTQKQDPFFLASGAGNLFAILLVKSGTEVAKPEEINEICTSRGVEGVLFLEQLKPQTYRWHFFNRDGSAAEFCGNAARCAQAFLKQTQGSIENHHETKAGNIHTWTEGDRHWVQMPEVKILAEKVTLNVDSQSFVGFWCDTGVPHFVTPQRNYRYDFWKQISQKMRNAPELGERGANITWIGSPTAGRPLHAVTFERGVEDFTQACGTGAMAAALQLKQKWPDQELFEIRMPGGLLTIRQTPKGWIMTGPVEKMKKTEGQK